MAIIAIGSEEQQKAIILTTKDVEDDGIQQWREELIATRVSRLTKEKVAWAMITGLSQVRAEASILAAAQPIGRDEDEETPWRMVMLAGPKSKKERDLWDRMHEGAKEEWLREKYPYLKTIKTIISGRDWEILFDEADRRGISIRTT